MLWKMGQGTMKYICFSLLIVSCTAFYTRILPKHYSPRSTQLHFRNKDIAVICVLGGLLFPIVPGCNAVYLQDIHSSIAVASQGTIYVEEGEVARIYQKALQTLSDGELLEAQKLFEQVVQVQPDFIDGWSYLGTVLTGRGFLDQGLLCYKKAISLFPPKSELWVLLLNKGSIELSTGKTDEALQDFELAQKIAGDKPEILTNQAVGLSNLNRWAEACELFEKVISSADRNASPWWLRYSMSLLEVGRGVEAVAYLQRTLNRFPYEPECNAFAVALYTSLGSKVEASTYWKKLTVEERDQFRSSGYIDDKLKWGPKAKKSFQEFLISASSSK